MYCTTFNWFLQSKSIHDYTVVVVSSVYLMSLNHLVRLISYGSLVFASPSGFHSFKNLSNGKDPHLHYLLTSCLFLNHICQKNKKTQRETHKKRQTKRVWCCSCRVSIIQTEWFAKTAPWHISVVGCGGENNPII